MNVELENGEIVTLVTPQGVIVVNTDAESGTLVTVQPIQGHKLSSEMKINSKTDQQNALVWVEPAAEL